jgi:hypothetical protein
VPAGSVANQEDTVLGELLTRWTRRRAAIRDDHIFWVLRAAEEGRDPADLCAAIGATLPMFCVWRAKYGTLTLEELKSLRQAEAERTTLRRLAVGAALVIGLAGVALIALLGGGPPPEDDLAEVPESHRIAEGAPMPAEPTSDHRAAAADPLASDARPALETPRTEVPKPRAVVAAALVPVAHDGYSVQVAAMPDARLARQLVERLGAAGYAAYVVPTVVKDAEVFRVRVGPFESRTTADETAVRLVRDGYTGAWVAR